MWSMRSSATEGFTLSEMLLALGTAMLCSVLLTWMVRFFVIGIHTQQQLVQDQIAVLQLRLLCAEAQEVKIDADALQLRRFGEELRLDYHQGRLVRRPGYVIYLQAIDDALFEYRGERIVMHWNREDVHYEAQVR